MNDTESTIHIITDFTETPKTPKATWLDWVKYFVFNTYRKPIVWRRQKELIRILAEVKLSLSKELLPTLWDLKSDCDHCRDCYMALKPQVFLSAIKNILENMACIDHGSFYIDFYRKNEHKFKQSEEIAAWINGFR